MSSPVVVPPNQALPPSLRAGDQLLWSVSTSLPAGTLVWFSLTAVLGGVPVRQVLGDTTNGGPNPLLVDGTGLVAISIPSAVTALWQPGLYEWVAFAVDVTGNRTQIASGFCRVLPDLGAATPVDPRSYNQRLLDAIRTLLQGKALNDVISYKIGTRELTALPLADLLKWEAVMESRVRKERIRRGEFVPTKTVGIQFGGR